VTLPVLFDGIVLLVLRRHDLIQVNLVVQKVVKVQAFERLQHLLDALLKVLNQILVFNLELTLGEQDVLLLHSLGLFVENALEDVVLVVFGFHLASLQIDDLTQLVHRV
jgi:hypothetical protein